MKTPKNKIHFEARLKRAILRTPYGMRKIYKKGTLIVEFSEKQFKSITSENIHKYTDLCLCEGHGVYEYFDLEKDIEFVQVEIITTKKVTSVKLKS